MAISFFNGTNDQPNTATLLSIENDIQMVCYAELGEIMYGYHSLHYCIGNPVWSNTQTLTFCSRVAQRKRAGPITQRFQIITLTKIFKKMVRLNWIHHFDIVDNPTF